jgi:hypothetical protein
MSCQHETQTTKFCPECGVSIENWKEAKVQEVLNHMTEMYQTFMNEVNKTYEQLGGINMSFKSDDFLGMKKHIDNMQIINSKNMVNLFIKTYANEINKYIEIVDNNGIILTLDNKFMLLDKYKLSIIKQCESIYSNFKITYQHVCNKYEFTWNFATTNHNNIMFVDFGFYTIFNDTNEISLRTLFNKLRLYNEDHYKFCQAVEDYNKNVETITNPIIKEYLEECIKNALDDKLLSNNYNSK